MELRSHPLMCYRTVRNWPPTWVERRAGIGGEELRGEIGVLKEVVPSILFPGGSRFFLIVEHENKQYIGCLIFDDATFCQEIFRIVRTHIGWRIADVGSLDVSHLL